MLNIAGPEYDFGSVVFVVLEECEHRRRGFDYDEAEFQLLRVAKEKLAQIKKAYDEFGGAPSYWKVLETEVLDTAMPQYIDAAREMTALERASFGIWRGGDPVSRFVFGIGGLLIGSVIIALPFVPIFETMFAFGLSGLGVLYPEVKRFTHERRHFRVLNRLVMDAVKYQQNAKLHYMTSSDIRESFAIDSGKQITDTATSETAVPTDAAPPDQES